MILKRESSPERRTYCGNLSSSDRWNLRLDIYSEYLPLSPLRAIQRESNRQTEMSTAVLAIHHLHKVLLIHWHTSTLTPHHHPRLPNDTYRGANTVNWRLEGWPCLAGGTRYIYMQSTTVYVPSSELGLPQPLSLKRVFPPPHQRVGGTLACGCGGWGVPIPTIGEKA